MQITCYSGFSKKPNSTKQPTSGTSKTVTLKQPTSVMNPVFVMEGYNLAYNYIQWGSRYYYVDDIIIVHNNIAEYHCSTDVLATYKNDIGSSSQYILRSSASFNGNIQDFKYPTLANPTAIEQTLTNLNTAMKNTAGGYILGTVGADSTENGVCYNLMGYSEFQQFLNYMFTGSYLSASDISIDLQKELINPFQYVVSCLWFPFLDGTAGHFGSTVKFGFWDSHIGCTVIDEDNRTYTVTDALTLTRHPQANTRGNFLNSSPFTRRQLEVFGFGITPIDSSYFVNSQSCAVQVKVDKYTGVGELTVESAGATVIKTHAQVGVPIKLSQITQPVLAPAMAVVGSVGSVLSHKYAGAIQGIGSAIQSAMPQVQSSGSTGSKIDFQRIPRITSQFFEISSEDNTTIGRPLCTQSTISSLGGYMECENADLDTNASPSEKATIISNMNSGFYYE